MIARPKIEDSQSYTTLGQALPPVLAVTNGSNPLLLLPKQAEGLGQSCPKTVCPSNFPSGSFQKLYILILREKSEKTIHITAQYFNFQLKSPSRLVWQFRPKKQVQLIKYEQECNR